MVEEDLKAIKSAIESMKASNWANRNEIIKQLEEDLDALYEEIIKSYPSAGYNEAQTLINPLTGANQKRSACSSF